MDTTDLNKISFDMPKNQSNVIKVIGVGGGGGNAINHMFSQGIKGVDFVICNTDSQALENSPVPTRIQLGVSLTEGLGAGANPTVGEEAALESVEDIKTMLDTNTKMVFITAGMGGGTGTGAAPIIAKMAKEMDILTVGIVTSPFLFEGKQRNEQAQEGIDKLRANVDSLIVINNNKLREVYGNLGFKAGFSKADEVLSTAARGIAEVITHHYTQNIDLRDAKTVLSNSGTAIMGSASASGSNRAHEAISKALDSPLLNDNKIRGSKNVLLLIVSGAKEITIDEIGEINDFIQAEAGHSANIIMGVGEDESKEDAITITIIATGFDVEQQNQITNTENKKIIHTLEDGQKAERQLLPKPDLPAVDRPLVSEKKQMPVKEEPIKHTLFDEVEEPKLAFAGYVEATAAIKNMQVQYEEVLPDSLESFEQVQLEDLDVEDFVIVTPTQKKDNLEVPQAIEEEEKEEGRGGMLMFDLEAPKPAQHKASPEARESSLQQRSEVKEPKVKRYTLEEEDEQDTPRAAYIEEEEETDHFLQFKTSKKQVAEPAEEEEIIGEVDPMNAPISKVLRERTEERKRSLKAFNYKFRDKVSRIDKIEKEPAYKRQGIELTENQDMGLSRTSINTSEEDIELRSNNSFLHDNVD
ncbi:MAG TPA: cell division protein FtsZ [Flavobacteriaceae bacterium]|nr:cell division protein FtsZ [Flavobacteriaceae bacterium]